MVEPRGMDRHNWQKDGSPRDIDLCGLPNWDSFGGEIFFASAGNTEILAGNSELRRGARSVGPRRSLLFPFGKLAVAAALISVATLPIFAQQMTGSDASCDKGLEFATLSAAPSAMALAPPTTFPTPEKKKIVERTIDNKFLFLFGMAAALTVTDIELTQHCLQAGTCHEANILYGNNPTRARMYGFNLPVLGAQAVFSVWLRRRYPERSRWIVPPIADSAAHAIGSITDASK